MSVFRILGMTIFLVGILLVAFGLAATQKTGEKVADEVTGHYSDTTMWYIIGGGVLIVIGTGVARIKR